MGLLWSGPDKGFRYEAIACFERGMVWEGVDPGLDYEAIGSYGSHRIWDKREKGLAYEAVGHFDDGYLWEGADSGLKSDAFGRYAGGLIWSGNEEGWKRDAIGSYEGSEVGAAAAALLFLLGGGDSSLNDSTASSEDEEPEGEHADDDESDSDDCASDDEDFEYTDDRSYGDDDSSQENRATSLQRAVEAKRSRAKTQFTDARTIDDLEQMRRELINAGAYDDGLKAIYRSKLEIFESARLDRLLPMLEGWTTQQLHKRYRDEMGTLDLSALKAHKYLELDSYKLYDLSHQIDVLAECSPMQVELFAKGISENVTFTVLGRRRWKEIQDAQTNERLAQIEPVEEAGTDELSDYFFSCSCESHDLLVEVIRRVQDRTILMQICSSNSFKDSGVAEAARARYHELLKTDPLKTRLLRILLPRAEDEP